MILQINGQNFEVGTINLSRAWTVEDKYRITTASGAIKRKVKGVYKSYGLNLRNVNDSTYNRLIDVLTDGSDYHTVTLPYGENGTTTFEAVFSDISDELIKTIGTTHHWDNLTINFEAKIPGGGIDA